MNEQTTILEHRFLHSLRASSKPAARGRVKIMTRTFGENFWRRSYQWARRMGQAILLVRHQKFSPNLHKWACLQAIACRLKRAALWNAGMALSPSAYFSLENRLGRGLLATSSQPCGKKVRGKIATENDWDKMALSRPLQRQNRK